MKIGGDPARGSGVVTSPVFVEVDVKTGDTALALPPREPSADAPLPSLPARRAATFAAVTGIVALTVWSAILTKQARNPMPLLSVEPVAVGEPVLSGDRLAGISEVEEEAEEAFLDTVEEFVGPIAIPSFETLSPELQKLCADPAVRWFNGRPVKPAKTITMKVTAYSPDARSCGDSADGITATLHSVETNDFKLVAADPKLLPYGSMLTIPGYADNGIVPVLDCGGAIKGRHIDLLFPTHEQARKWGVKKIKVIVWQYVDGKPADNPRKLR